jgi:hypothetical protein
MKRPIGDAQLGTWTTGKANRRGSCKAGYRTVDFPIADPRTRKERRALRGTKCLTLDGNKQVGLVPVGRGHRILKNWAE